MLFYNLQVGFWEGSHCRKQNLRPFNVFMSCWNLSILNHFLPGNTSVCRLAISPHPARICGLCSKTLLLATRVGIRLFSVCRWHGNKRIPRSLVFFLTRTNYVWQQSWVHRKAFPTSAPSVSVSFLSWMNKHCHPHLWMRTLTLRGQKNLNSTKAACFLNLLPHAQHNGGRGAMHRAGNFTNEWVNNIQRTQATLQSENTSGTSCYFYVWLSNIPESLSPVKFLLHSQEFHTHLQQNIIPIQLPSMYLDTPPSQLCVSCLFT